MNANYLKEIEGLISENILNIIPESIAAVNTSGEVIYWNKGAETIFGYHKEEILGKSLKLIYPDLNEESLFSDLGKIKEREHDFIDWEGVHKSGSSVWVSLYTSILKDKNNQVIGFIGISRDITAQKQLQKYKSEFSSIIEYSDEGISSMDLDGYILSWSEGSENIYGYAANEVIGKNAEILYPENNKKQLEKNLEIIRSGKSIKGLETKRKRKDGSIINISLTFSPLKKENGQIYGISIIARDITEQKQTVKELIESEIKYQTIFENSGEGFLLMTDTFLDCNKKLAEMWGYSKKEIIGKTPGYFSPKFQSDGSLSEEKAKKYIQKAFKDGTANFYWQHINSKGEILETRISLNRIRVGGEHQIIAVVQDLSELFNYQNELKAKTNELIDQNAKILKLNDDLNETNKQLKIINEQIEHSERKFRVAFKTSPDAVNINRLSDGIYVDINTGFTQLTGYTEDDIKGKTSSELNIWVNQKDRKKLVGELKRVGYISNLEAKFKRKDGSTTTALMSASIIDVKGEEHIISITRDISERKKIENDLLKAMEKAEESDRLKSAFLANMSHEIRTPMNAILGFNQLLKEKQLDKEKQNKFLDIISSRSKNLLEIINDIIDISKIEANQLKMDIREFSLNKILYELFTEYEAELVTLNKESIKLEINVNLDKKSSVIKSDELRLKQILNNLISNAVKFTEIGKIEFGYIVKGTFLEFFVRDTGVGINKDSQNHIFDRFRQADDSNTREFGGTGLGLSISKQLVEMLGGKIWVESEHKKGASFYFIIPFRPVKSTKEEKDSVLNYQVDFSDKTFLIVEDDLISMAYLEELLGNTKAKILKAMDGLQAVKVFKENQKIDLVLMDVYLPKMNGNEVTLKIKKINKSVPVIMQSAYAMTDDKKESFKHGCDDYITKPIDSHLLFSLIKKHIFLTL